MGSLVSLQIPPGIMTCVEMTFYPIKVAVTLIFVLIPTVQRTSTTYLLLGKITSKIYVSQFFVPVQYFPLTNFLPWCKASNF